MELSKFNFYSHYEKDKGGLIYNTNTGAIINIIDCCQWDTIKRNNIDSLTNEELTELCKQGIVVHSCMEEFNIIKERYYKKRNSSASLFLTIMPTDACNFRCPYCLMPLWRSLLSIGSEANPASAMRTYFNLRKELMRLIRITLLSFNQPSRQMVILWTKSHLKHL